VDVAFSLLARILAHASRDRELARELGISSKRQLARRLGIAESTLRRYLTGTGRIPERIGARLIDLQAEAASIASAYWREKAAAQGIPYAAPPGVPTPVQRYGTPLVTGLDQSPSRIITVDVDGLTNAEVAQVLRTWWDTLRERGGDWDLRLQARIFVQQYFEGQRIQDKSLRKYVKGKTESQLWLSPRAFFRRRTGLRGARKMNYPNATAMLRSLNESFAFGVYAKYTDRLPQEYTFTALAFIPIEGTDGGKRWQKRKGKR
jgi:transcriptional regulator with XRE-family HTH domain